MSDASDDSAEDGELDEHPAASPLDERSIYGSALAPGFMLVRGHASGKPCFQHLQTRVVTWARPYVVPHEATFEAHEPPRPLARALTTVKRQNDQNGHLQSRGTKRPLPPPAAAPAPPPPPPPPPRKPTPPSARWPLRCVGVYKRAAQAPPCRMCRASCYCLCGGLAHARIPSRFGASELY